jgi:hypothetical protein
MVAFKTTATKGIEEGMIKSIIHPTLAITSAGKL